MIEMTLSSRHRIRNSSPGGLRPSTLPLGHGGSPNIDFHTWMGKKHFWFLSNRQNREPNPELWRERQHTRDAWYDDDALFLDSPG